MKNIMKIFTLLIVLLFTASHADARLRYGRVATDDIAGGTLEFYSDAACQTALGETVAAGSTVYIKATANYNKRLGTADAQGKVSFIKVEQTVSSGVAMSRGDGLGLGECVDVYQVSKKLDEGIYKFTMPADENINVLVSAEFADPAPSLHAQITSVATKYAIDENADKGTVLAQITVVDKAKVDGDYEKLSYMLKSNYDTQKFNETFEVNEVNNFSGVRTVEISVKNQELLDYENVKFGGATLYAVNESGDYACAHFDIFINDLSEDFTISNQAFTLPEKQEDGSNWQAGKEVGDVIINDPDDGAIHTYKVIATGVPFNFAPGTNKLVVTDGSVLDYETKSTWTFEIKVSDGVYTHNASITVKLTDVNEAPMIQDVKNTYTIKENSANGTELGKFNIIDNDNNDNGYEQLTYKLEGTISDLFEVKEKANRENRTVSIVVKDASKLDYEKYYNKTEENATFPITFTATDTDGNSASVKTYFAIEDVNEDLTATGGTFYLNEHSPVGSKVYKEEDCQTVGKVSAEDKDLYHADFRKLSYKMSTNNTGTDAEKFKVDPRSGVITSAAVFDYEKDSKSYSFWVTVSDGEFSNDVEVNVNITNIEEPSISWEEADVYVEENTNKDEVIANINNILDKIKANNEAIQNELGKIVGDVSFEIDQVASGDAGNLFDIDDDGSIKVKNSLDFESLYPNNTFIVKVVASGEDNEQNLIKCNIDIKIVVTDVNETPSASDLKIEIPETKTSADGSIGKVEADDPDFMSKISSKATPNGTHPLGFNKLHYMFEDVDSDSDFPFEINENTGDITVREGETLNYVKHNEYKFKVKVTDCAIDKDNAPLSTKAIVTIKITDVNIPSKFISLGNVYKVEENVGIGTELEGGYITVYDEDAADVCTSSKSSLTITITDNNATPARDAAKLFEIVRDGNTNNKHITPFVIKTKAGIDYESLYDKNSKDAIFDVTLTIKDSEERTKYPQKNCKIRVNDVNEEPTHGDTQFECCIIENKFNSITFGNVEVSDPDTYNTEYSTLYYSLEGDDAAPFAINAAGEISKITGANLDYETNDTYKFNVVVTDKKNTVKIPVIINVNNENELPEFTEKNPVLLVDERAEKGTVVGTITAIDDDTKNGKSGEAPKYSFYNDPELDDYKYFDIDESTGVITVKDEHLPDFNKKREYHIMVAATDGDDPWVISYEDVVIKARLKLENLFTTDNAFTSYVAPDNLAVPEGLSAYAVTDIDGTSATIQQIDYLPQSVPVLIKRADKTENLYKATTGNGTAFYVNKLQINETDREVSAGELYLLYRDEFVLTSSGTLPAGSVYLPITDLAVKTRSLTIGNGEGTTSIENLTPALSESEGEWYDLQGRRLGNKPNRKGIYISNGRKVVIK